VDGTTDILESGFPVVDALIAEAEEAASTGKTDFDDTGKKIYVEFYFGKVKRNGKTIKTGFTYWTYAVYREGKRLYRISPKRYAPDDFGFEGATKIEHCPYTGRVTAYWKKQQRAALGGAGIAAGFPGGDETAASVVDGVQQREGIFVH
jgi:hypothetical protein